MSRLYKLNMASLVLSSEEKHYIVSGIEEDFRTDGRACDDYRYVTVETGVVTNSNGSAQLKMADTNVLIGVKAEIGEPLDGKEDEGRVEFFVDCSANASPLFEGRGGDELAFELTSVLEKTFSAKTFDLKKLCVIPSKACWVLYIDALVLECGGNLFDALSMGVKSALHNTRIPNLSVVGEGDEMTFEISDDPYNSSTIDTTNVPLLITFNKIGERYVVDATPEEEVCSDARIIMSVNEVGKVCSLQKGGEGGVYPDLLVEIIEVGKKIGKTFNEKLNRVLSKQAKESV